MTIYQKLLNLKNTTGTKAKQDLIRQYKSDELFINICRFLLDTNIKTNINKAKIHKSVSMVYSADTQINDLNQFIEYLSQKSTGKDTSILSIQNFIIKHNNVEQDVLTELATKSFKLGIGIKGFDPVIKLFGHIHEVQLANKFYDRIEKVKAKYPKSKCYITQKLDGIRANVISTDDGVKVLSRQNKPFHGMSEIFNQFGFNGMYDGELIIPGKTFNQIQSVVMSESADKSDVKFYIFDKITVDDYYNKTSKQTYEERLIELGRNWADYEFSDRIELVAPLAICDIKEVESVVEKLMLEVAMPNGWEGLMVNIGDACYDCKRTDAILKVKKFDTVDLKIIGFNEGDGRKKGTLGAFVCEYRGNEINVAGFSDDVGREVWTNKSKYLGMTIEVKFLEESQDHTGAKSLRSANFLHFRYDK